MDKFINDTYRLAQRKTIKLIDSLQYHFYELFKRKDLFQPVENYCMFIGYTRSGHSLVGSLLDAHPNIVISHELNALRLFEKGANARKVYYFILQNSQRQANSGRQETGYSYQVPGQWQGRYKQLKVIGDKKGSHSNLVFRTNPEILNILQREIDVPIKFIHVTRNPYDNIATMITKKKADLDYGIGSYFKKCKTVANLKQQISEADILDVRHEALIDDPQTTLKELCDFLGVEAPKDYLEACTSIIFKSPQKSRFKVQWTDKSIEIVKNQIDQFEFLKGYSYED